MPLRRGLALWVVLCCASGFAEAQAMKFDRAVIRDPAVANLEGATLLMPAGYKLEGGFQWMPLLSMQANLMIRITDPATGASIETLPAQQFAVATQDMGGLTMQPGANWNGSIYLPPPRDAAEFVQNVLGQALPHLRGAKILRTDRMPKLEAEAAKGTPPNFTLRCTRIRYAFEVQGKPWEEDVTSTLTFAPPNGWTAMWWCSGTAMRAPAGQLDQVAPALSVPIRSLRITLPWYARLEEIRQVFSQGRLKEQQDLARFQQAWTQSRAEIEEKHRQNWDARWKSQERQSLAMREILGGTETYTNPYESRTVDLPGGYKAYWVSNQGKVLLSDDVGVDPRQGSTEEWRKMERYTP